MPVSMILHFTVPLVDYDKPEDNWNKLLNSFHLLSGPLAIVLLTQGTSGDHAHETIDIFRCSGIHENWQRLSRLGWNDDIRNDTLLRLVDTDRIPFQTQIPLGRHPLGRSMPCIFRVSFAGICLPGVCCLGGVDLFHCE